MKISHRTAIEADIEDIKKARDKWEADRAANKKATSAEHAKYNEALDEVLNGVKQQLVNNLSKFNLLNFDVNVRMGFHKDQIQVDISCNDHMSSDDVKGLSSWRYSARIDYQSGKIIRDTTSSTNFKGTTDEDVEALLQTAQACKYLNSVDWETLLHTKTPDWKTYHPTEEDTSPRPNFEQQILEEEVKDAIANKTLLHGTALENFGYLSNSNGWYLILKETPKMYVAGYIPDFSIEVDNLDRDDAVAYASKYYQRIRKDTLLSALDDPIQTW